jgi:hypothetical protein
MYVKDEGVNLNTLTNALINIISRVSLFIVKTICYWLLWPYNVKMLL